MKQKRIKINERDLLCCNVVRGAGSNSCATYNFPEKLFRFLFRDVFSSLGERIDTYVNLCP